MNLDLETLRDNWITFVCELSDKIETLIKNK